MSSDGGATGSNAGATSPIVVAFVDERQHVHVHRARHECGRKFGGVGAVGDGRSGRCADRPGPAHHHPWRPADDRDVRGPGQWRLGDHELQGNVLVFERRSHRQSDRYEFTDRCDRSVELVSLRVQRARDQRDGEQSPERAIGIGSRRSRTAERARADDRGHARRTITRCESRVVCGSVHRHSRSSGTGSGVTFRVTRVRTSPARLAHVCVAERRREPRDPDGCGRDERPQVDAGSLGRHGEDRAVSGSTTSGREGALRPPCSRAATPATMLIVQRRSAAILLRRRTRRAPRSCSAVHARGSSSHHGAVQLPGGVGSSRPTSTASTPRSTSASSSSTHHDHGATRSPPSTVRCRSCRRSPATSRRSRSIATGSGLVFAQNMMYRHTMTVYDDSGALVKTIPDSVDLASFGYPGHAGVSRGAPVEGAVSPDHRYFYVTNYSMYGADFGPEGSDNCSGPGGLSPSFVYRIDLKTLTIDGRHPGRDGAEVHRGHARQPLHPRDQLVLLRPQRDRPRDVQGDPPHPARHRSARHRREPVVDASPTSR